MSIRSANSNRVLANGDTYSERVKNSLIADINNGFISSNPSYFDVLFNDNITTTEVQITQLGYDTSDKAKYKIVMKPNVLLNCGDIITWRSKKWLVTSVQMFNDIYYWGVLQECKNILKFYKNAILYQLPCIFNNGSINMTDGKFMSLPSGHYMIQIKNDNIITKADLNLRFILNGSAYKIEGIDNSQNGLLKIEIVDDQINDDDNIQLGICNYYSNQKSEPTPSTEGWTVSLTPTTEKLMLGRTLELTAHAYNNGVEDNTKFFLYTVTNEDGSTNNYVTTTILTNVCKLVAGTKSTYAGKIINVHCALLGDPTVYYDRKIKLVSF